MRRDPRGLGFRGLGFRVVESRWITRGLGGVRFNDNYDKNDFEQLRYFDFYSTSHRFPSW